MNTERQIKDYFVEDIQEDTWTGLYRLITDAKVEDGKTRVVPSEETWNFVEALRFSQLCQELDIKPPVNQAKELV